MTTTATLEREEEVTALRNLTESTRGTQRDREWQELLTFAEREMSSNWFYDLELNGAEIEGIGIEGALELAAFRAEQGFPIHFYNGIELLEVERNGKRGVQATVVAREGRSMREGLGVAFYPYERTIQVLGADKTEVDPRADRAALSIAKRNAILDLIPAHIGQAILDMRSHAIPANDKRRAELRTGGFTDGAYALAGSSADNPDAYAGGRLQSRMRSTPTPATTRQIVRLLQLAQHPSVSDTVRATIKAKLEGNLSEALAKEWIDILEPQVADAEATHSA